MPQYLASSGLHRRALREVWNVANPQMKDVLGQEEFARCCRLIAHCQALAGKDPYEALFKEGGRPLRVFLREQCLGRQPRQPPRFR